MHTNLASTVLGTSIVFATDEWFAAADNLLKTEEPVWKEDLFTEYGKWMDGWESRRRRTEGNDWCIIKLGIPGIVNTIEVDTKYFSGNFSPGIIVRGTYMPNEPEALATLRARRQADLEARPGGRMGTRATEEEFALVNTVASADWPTLVPLSPLPAGIPGSSVVSFTIDPINQKKVSHIRIDQAPDGGIARIKIHGRVVPDFGSIPLDKDVDLAGIEVGSLAVAWSNKHYGHPNNLIAPGRGTCMGDGWETARQPSRPPSYLRQEDGLMLLPGSDWAIIRLGVPGIPKEIIVDTNFYKGNFPESCLIEGIYLPMATDDDFHDIDGAESKTAGKWRTLVKRVRLGSSMVHVFPVEEDDKGSMMISHVRITIYPDGGVMRLRVIGRKAPESKL